MTYYFVYFFGDDIIKMQHVQCRFLLIEARTERLLGICRCADIAATSCCHGPGLISMPMYGKENTVWGLIPKN